MDADGYPNQAELHRIQEWPYQDCAGLLAFVRSLWWHPEYISQSGEGGRVFHISTAGWSGNESLIAAMERNEMFWLFAWQSSRRGGHYEFEVPKSEGEQVRRVAPKKKPKKKSSPYKTPKNPWG